MSNSYAQFFIGADDLQTEGDFKRLDGTRLASGYNYWSLGEPNNQQGDNCVVFFDRKRVSQGDAWNDCPCDSTMAYSICEYTQ